MATTATPLQQPQIEAAPGAFDADRETATVLIVEDEPAVRRALARTLRSTGYEVTTAVEGNVALRAISEQSFALVVLDLTLVSPDGWTVLRRLRRHHPEVPVLLMSENPFETLASVHGAAGLLRKPVDAARLLAVVRSTLDPATNLETTTTHATRPSSAPA